MELYEVTHEIFKTFIDKHKLNEVQGEIMHSSYFVNSQGEKHAYMESSSWGAETIYKISDVKYQNFESLNLINTILNKRSQ